MTPYEVGAITGFLLGVATCVWCDTFLASRKRRRDALEQRVAAIEAYLKPLQDYGKEH